MKNPSSTRPYRMGARADSAAQTAHAILSAAIALWREYPIDEITLDAIAERSGVSVRTVIRRFGSKDGVIEACIETDVAGIREERDQGSQDIEKALDILLGHYERDGDPILRTVALEGKVSVAAVVAQTGRREHRAWCARVFAAHLPPPDEDDHSIRLDAFVAATDLYLWKLLRRDMGRSLADTKQAIRILVQGLLTIPQS